MAETFAYNLVFIRIEDGKDPEDVKQKLSTALKTDLERVQAWIDSAGPVTLLKEVDEETAQKVKQIVTRCGARSIIERVELEESVGGLSLVPKKYRTTDDFVCPACGFQKEVSIGQVVETCESCGTVIAKWRERQRLEKEKEEMRKRLLREAESAQMSEEERKRKEEELKRLQKLEDELRRELGLKAPGPLWRFFERHPVSVTLVLSSLIVILSAAGTYLYTQYLEAKAQEALVAAEPSLEMTQLAPVMASAVQVQQTGNQQIIAELANVSGVLNGQQPQDNQAIQDAATLMMKGAGSEQFMGLVAKGPQAGSGDAPAAKVLPKETMGAVTGLAGVASFAPHELPVVAQAVTGSEQVLEVFARPDQVMATEENPQAPPRNAIEQLDGSAIIDLMKSLNNDYEWSQYLGKHVAALAAAGKLDEADAVCALITEAGAKALALAEIQVAMTLAGRPLDARVYQPRIEAALETVKDAGLRTELWLRLALVKAKAGDTTEPVATLDLQKQAIDALQNDYDRALALASLASYQFEQGDREGARALFARANGAAGRLADKAERLIAFARIARQYHRVRATTVAHQILGEAARIAAAELSEAESARVFAELAVSHALMGDLAGARLAVANTGSLQAQMQVSTRMAEAMIANGQYFEVMDVLARIPDSGTASRLMSRSAGAQLAAGQVEDARRLLVDLGTRLRLISDPYDRAVQLAKLGRLYARIGDPGIARELFGQALSFTMTGPKADVTRATIAMEQAQSLLLEESLKTLFDLENAAYGEPVGNVVRSIKDVMSFLIASPETAPGAAATVETIPALESVPAQPGPAE